MKPTLTIAILTVFATVGFAIELVTTPPTATNSSACSACREAACSAEKSSCQDCSTTDAKQQTIAEFLTGTDCRESCDQGRVADLKAAGLDPYRIEPTDVLTISVPIPHPELDHVRRDIRAAVNPDGSIAVPGIGDVRVSGMTPKEAECEIIKRILKSNPEASQTVFSVSVDVAAKNSKRAYVVLQGGARGDNVWQIPATADTTVGSALRKSAWPHPIDFASAKMWVARPCTTSESCEASLPVTWNSQTGQPTDATDHALLPGDRLFVQLPTKSAPPTPTSAQLPNVPLLPEPLPPITATAIASDLPPISIVAPAPLAAPQPYSPIALQAPGAPIETRYSAVPAAVPSPCAPKPSPYAPSALIATQSYSVAAPLASSAPVLPSRPCTEDVTASARTSAKGEAIHADSTTEIAQVRFDVEVIEDHTGSLQEFKSLQGEMPILTAESEVILPTIRILEKQELIRRISSPKLITVVDQPAHIQIGSNVPDEVSGKSSFHGMMLKTAARELGGGLCVDFQFRDSSGGHVLEVQTSLLIAHGQTIVMKTTGRHRDPSENGEQETADNRPVYVVLTPELIK